MSYIQQDNEYDYAKYIIQNQKCGGTFAIIFLGPPGTAKSTFARTLASDLGCGIFVIDGTPSADRRDFEGNMEITPEGTSFKYGKIAKAMKSANENGLAILLVDEINAILESEQIAFNPVIAEGEMHMIATNEDVKLNKDAKLVLIGTMNPGVLGICDLQEAFDDRFSHNFIIDYPTEEKEIEIVSKMSGLDLKVVEYLVAVGRQLRLDCIDNGTYDKPISTRMLVNIAEELTFIPLKFLKNTIETMVINKLGETPERRKTCELFLSGMDFTEKLKELITETRNSGKEEETKEEETKEEEIKVNTTHSFGTADRDAIKTIKNYMEGKKWCTTTLRYLSSNHKKEFRLFFKKLGDVKEYEYTRKTGKSPFYSGNVTKTFLKWMYVNNIDELKEYAEHMYKQLERINVKKFIKA